MRIFSDGGVPALVERLLAPVLIGTDKGLSTSAVSRCMQQAGRREQRRRLSWAGDTAGAWRGCSASRLSRALRARPATPVACPRRPRVTLSRAPLKRSRSGTGTLLPRGLGRGSRCGRHPHHRSILAAWLPRGPGARAVGWARGRPPPRTSSSGAPLLLSRGVAHPRTRI